MEGSCRDEGGGDREVHGRPHRPSGEPASALWTLSAAMPEGAQHSEGSSMARSIDAEAAAETALPPPASRMSPMRRASGGLSLGRAVGASDHGSVQCGSAARPRTELAGNGPPVRLELEERGDDCETGGAVWVETPHASARACQLHPWW